MDWRLSKLRPKRSRRDRGAETDRDLEALRRGGDREEIFRRLYLRHYRSVDALFALRGCSAEDRRDLAQETFLRAFDAIGSFRGRSRFETWLYAIADNVWNKHLRARRTLKRDRPEVSLDGVETAPDRGADALRSPRRAPEGDLLSKERVALVRAELERLPPRMRRCLQLRLQELKFREIAVLEQVSVNTVRSQLAQAKARLKQNLGGYFGELEVEETKEVAS